MKPINTQVDTQVDFQLDTQAGAAPDEGPGAAPTVNASLLTEERPAERLALAFATQALGWARARGASAASQRAVFAAAVAVSRATTEGHVCVHLADLPPLAAVAGGADSEDVHRAAGEKVSEPASHPANGHASEHTETGASESAAASAADDPRAALLLASGVVGRPAPWGSAQPPWPLLLDAGGRLYLQRYFAHERALAARLLLAMRAPPQPLTPELQALLQRLFQPNEAALAGEVDRQKLAAALALRGRLTLISGGPGTGKTTTVVNLLACLLAQDPNCRIALAAPTGKAAARMTEAIRQRATHLPADLQALLPTEASTVHRLLGVLPAPGADGQRYAHHAARPLALDVLVVDEASMLDLALARRLLDAVPPGARIVLLGDKDQLSAVEAGAVFAELSARPGLGAAARAALAADCGVAPAALQVAVDGDSDVGALPAASAAAATPAPSAVPAPSAPSATPSPAALLGEHVVWFTRNFRFAASGGIGRLAADIQAARVAPLLAWLRQGQDTAVRWIAEERAGGAGGAGVSAVGGTEVDAAVFDSLQAGFAPYLAALQHTPHDAAAITAAFNRFRALCALREGPRGVQAINQRLSEHARAVLGVGVGVGGGEGGAPAFHGRPVMVLRNDPLLKLFNGDVGITLLDGSGQAWVYFPSAEGGFRAVPALRLPAHQTAFAMTVHKSQGSEFDAVLVLLPPQRSPVLTRELLYTAVTRARAQVTLVGSAEALAAAVNAPTRRRSGLLARLQELQETQDL